MLVRLALNCARDILISTPALRAGGHKKGNIMFQRYHKIILANTPKDHPSRAAVISVARAYKKNDGVPLSSYAKTAYPLVASGNERAKRAFESILNMIPIFERVMLLVEMT